MSIARIVAQTIIDRLREGVPPWRRPWRGVYNPVTGTRYRGVNALILAADGRDTAYVTLEGANRLGGRIRKGTPSVRIVFWKREKAAPSKTKNPETEEQEPDTADQRTRPVLRYYRVFPLSSVEGIDTDAVRRKGRQGPEITRHRDAEAVVRGMPTPPKIVVGGVKAYYNPESDIVSMPPMADFDSAAHYYQTLFHELVHATGHASRLNRPAISATDDTRSISYGREELVAEIGAAALCHVCGIEWQVEDSASYCKGWAAHIAAKPYDFIVAAAQADAAVAYVLGETQEVVQLHDTLDSEERQRPVQTDEIALGPGVAEVVP